MSGCTGFFIVTVAESVERAYPVSAGNAEEAKRKVEGLISDGLIAPPSRLGKAASSISCTHVSESTEDACLPLSRGIGAAAASRLLGPETSRQPETPSPSRTSRAAKAALARNGSGALQPSMRKRI